MKTSFSLKELSLELGYSEEKIDKILRGFSHFFKNEMNSDGEFVHDLNTLETLREIMSLADAGKSAIEIRGILETTIKEKTLKSEDTFRSDEYRMFKNKDSYDEGNKLYEFLQIIAEQKQTINSLNERVSSLEVEINKLKTKKFDSEEFEKDIMIKINDMLSEMFYKKS